MACVLAVAGAVVAMHTLPAKAHHGELVSPVLTCLAILAGAAVGGFSVAAARRCGPLLRAPSLIGGETPPVVLQVVGVASRAWPGRAAQLQVFRE